MDVYANVALAPGDGWPGEAIDSGMRATAYRWWHRLKAAGKGECRLGRWLGDRSSRPHWQLHQSLWMRRSQFCVPAARPAWPVVAGGGLSQARSTIRKVLHRDGVSQRRPVFSGQMVNF
jgi:hypothetical protein